LNYVLDTIFSVDILFENYEAIIIEPKKVVISRETPHNKDNQESLKMGFIVELNPEKCNSCEECLEACTSGVFAMRNGKSVPVNAKDCVGCLSCVELCEPGAITVEETGIEMSNTCAALLRNIL